MTLFTLHMSRDGPLGPVCKATRGVGRNLLHDRHETPRRTDRPGVGTAGAPRAARETRDGSAERGPSSDHQWDSVAAANRSTLAGSARAVWTVVDGVQPFSTLAAGRDLGSALGRGPTRGG